MTESILFGSDILLVGINISSNSAYNGALWSSQKTPWNVWAKAGIFKGYHPDLKLAVQHCNSEPYSNGFKVSFTDLVDIAETKSSIVKIEVDAHNDLKNKIVDNKIKNVVLMGDRVIQKFAPIHPVLIEAWKKMEENRVAYGKSKKKFHPKYGFMGEIKLDEHKVNIFGMPFPTTIPIKDKYEFYQKMVEEIKSNCF